MTTVDAIQLKPQEIRALASEYIEIGVKQDSWEIMEVEIAGESLNAEVRMCSTYVSPTDASGFHLTIFSTQEFLSQLANIYLHVWAGYRKKTRELWMRDCHITCIKPIRNPNSIQVEMHVPSIKETKGVVIGIAEFIVSDGDGGLFKARLKGVLG